MAMIKNGGLLSYVAAILLIMPIPAAFAASQTVIKTSIAHNADEQIIRSQAGDYNKAFAAADAKAIADFWTLDATFIDINGKEHKGRSSIEAYFTNIFKLFGPQPLELAVESISFPADNVAVEQGSCRLAQGYSSGNMSRYTAIHVKNNDKWLMVSVTETNYASSSSDSLKDLDWLIGNWTAIGKNNTTVHFITNWAANGKFIRCIYLTGDNLTPDEMEVIGWNPRIGRVVSWLFDATGGFGYGKWLRDGQSWIKNANSVEADGTVSSGIYIIKKIDDNHFTWRSTGRNLDGQTLIDTPEIPVTRDQGSSK